jgi:hypothetical protein
MIMSKISFFDAKVVFKCKQMSCNKFLSEKNKVVALVLLMVLFVLHYAKGKVCRPQKTLQTTLRTRGRIWCDVAALLIRRARKLYSDTDLVGLGLKNTVYALDATTIDLCLSLFEWAPFRKAKGAIKLHTLLDLRGAIPAFMHISDGKLHEVNVLDFMPVEAGAFYVMDRGYLDFMRLYKMHCKHPTRTVLLTR